MDTNERDIFSIICENDGIKAKRIASLLGKKRNVINQYLYGSPYIKELCYRDEDYNWHGLIRQSFPHIGLEDFCGFYSDVNNFLEMPYDEWFEALIFGCGEIGRNLNDTRGLFHSFQDSYETMVSLFRDLEDVNCLQWEIVFELRIKKARLIRIYADVLVITDRYVFSLEFKMKDVIEEGDVEQAAKYNAYLEILFGPKYEVISGLVLTKATDLYQYVPLESMDAEIPVCSGDMLFNIFNEYLGFYEE